MSDRLDELLGQSTPPVSEFGPLKAEFDRLVHETEIAGRRRLRFRRRAAAIITIGTLAFGGTAAAAAPVLGRAIYHPTPAYPLSGKAVDVSVSYRWSSRVGADRVTCVSSNHFVLSGLYEDHLLEARSVVSRFYADFDVSALQKSSGYLRILDRAHVGDDPSRAELDRVTERSTLTSIMSDRLTVALQEHRLGLVRIDGSGSYHCADGK